MSEDTELLREIRDLLRLVAEPAIAKRDEALQARLRQIVGNSAQKAKAVGLMTGALTQSELGKAASMDQGNLSRLIKTLRDEDLLFIDSKNVKLRVDLQESVSAKSGDK